MKGWKFVPVLLAGLVLVGGSQAARADMIGLNFTGGAPGLLSTDSAGVVPQTNWNNVSGLTGTSGSLLDSTGTATGVTATWTGQQQGTFTGAPQGTDEILNNGVLFGNSEGGSVSVTINNIPYSSYDIYVYRLSNTNATQVTTLSGGPTYYATSPNPTGVGYVDSNGGTPFTYTQTTSTNPVSPTPLGDYVLFSGLSGSTQSFLATSPINTPDVEGFQIVSSASPVPEPSTWAMMFLGLGGIALSGWRKKRKDAAV